MGKLFLFDVDRTLVEGPENNRYSEAIKNLHKLDAEINFDPEGMTDKLILEALLEQQGWTDDQIQASIAKLIDEIHKVYKRSFKTGSVRLLPGVRELLEQLQKRRITLGLITGNAENVAEIKLGDAGIWHYFSVGGYGNDPHVTRGDLVTVAISKAGFKNNMDNVYVVGDTPRDIFAAKEARVKHTVGVANGYRKTQELIDAGAEIVIEDFKNTKDTLSKLGVG
jgi:phosphoglycolate phosphatase